LNHTRIATELEKNADVFRALLENIDREMRTWKQAEEKWCLLEIVCHLYDEEREDFRYRLNHTLTTPEQPMPPIIPVEWVKERDYMAQNYDKKLEAFLEERTQSVAWLRSLKDARWDNAYDHPKVGKLPATLFLVNWPAHDYLHFRQITKLKYDYLAAHSRDNLDYAGTW
jgi:hypothetical protein